MNATAIERRRNLYPANCCICMKEVASGDGWLYADTRSRPRRNSGGLYSRFPKKVKCDRCHRENVTNKWQANNLDNPQPKGPTSWSAPQVRKWQFEVETESTHKLVWPDPKGLSVLVPITLVHILFANAGERIQLAGGDPISNEQVGPHWTLEEKGIGGRPFSKAAWQVLRDRVKQEIARAKGE